MPVTDKAPVLVGSPLGEIGFALLVVYAHTDTPLSVPAARLILEDATNEVLKMQPVYDQLAKYVERGLLKHDGIEKSAATGRNVDLYRITPDGHAAVATKIAHMQALLALAQKLKPADKSDADKRNAAKKKTHA